MERGLSGQGGVYVGRDLSGGAWSAKGVVCVQRGGVGRCLWGAGPVGGGACAAGGALALAETVFAPAAVAAVGAGRSAAVRGGRAGGGGREPQAGARRSAPGAGAAERLRGTRERGAERTEVTAGRVERPLSAGLGPGGSDPLWIPGAGGGARGGTWAAPCPRRTGLHLVPSLCLSAEPGPELGPRARREAGDLLGPSGDCLPGLSRPSAGAGPVQPQPGASPRVCKLSTKKPRRTGQARAASVALLHSYTARGLLD